MSHYYKMIIVRGLRGSESGRVDVSERFFESPEPMVSAYFANPVVCYANEPLVKAVHGILGYDYPKGLLAVYVFCCSDEYMRNCAIQARVACLPCGGEWPEPKNEANRPRVEAPPPLKVKEVERYRVRRPKRI